MAENTPFPPEYVAETRGPRVIAVACLFIFLDVGIVTLRFATRYVYKTKSGIDDFLIIPALVFAVGICAIAIVEAKIAGVGRHLPVLYITDPQAVVNWAKCGYAIEEIYCASVAMPKISILASYLRIFTEKRYRVMTYTIGAIIGATAIAGIITSLASCRPFSARWDPALFNSNCIDAPRFWQGLSAPNIVTDVMMLILPMPVIWGLHMDRKQKVALSCTFILGSFGLIASIIRLTVTLRVTALSDGTWDSADIAIWSLVESGCYLIAACLPVLRPLYLNLLKAMWSLKSSDYLSSSLRSSFPKFSRTKDSEGHIYVEMDSYQNVESAKGPSDVCSTTISGIGNHAFGVSTSIRGPDGIQQGNPEKSTALIS